MRRWCWVAGQDSWRGEYTRPLDLWLLMVWKRVTERIDSVIKSAFDSKQSTANFANFWLQDLAILGIFAYGEAELGNTAKDMWRTLASSPEWLDKSTGSLDTFVAKSEYIDDCRHRIARELLRVGPRLCLKPWGSVQGSIRIFSLRTCILDTSPSS